MADLPADLDAAVNDQASARVAMNIQGYARYLAPEAVDTLRASFPGMPPRVSRYDIASATGASSDYIVDVRYYVRDESFIVRSKWRKSGDEWGVVHAERLWSEGESRPGFLSRLVGSVLGRLARGRRRS